MGKIRKQLIVAKALLLGIEVSLDGCVYQQHPEANDVFVCLKSKRFTSIQQMEEGNGVDHFIGGDDLNFNYILRRAEHISDDYAAVLSGDILLNEFKRG